MNGPACGNVISQIPRWACPWMHRVGELGRLEPGAGRVIVEEVPVDVERVDRVVLERVDQVDPDGLAALHLDRLGHVVERDPVHRVELVALGVERAVVAVLDHHHLVRVRPPLLRVDDERPVHPARDVLRERRDVAVVEVEAERLGVELVDGRLARGDDPRADAGDPVHRRRVEAVEVDRVRVRRPVHEPDAQLVALVCSAASARGSGRCTSRPGT